MVLTIIWEQATQQPQSESLEKPGHQWIASGPSECWLAACVKVRISFPKVLLPIMDLDFFLIQGSLADICLHPKWHLDRISCFSKLRAMLNTRAIYL